MGTGLPLPNTCHLSEEVRIVPSLFCDHKRVQYAHPLHCLKYSQERASRVDLSKHTPSRSQNRNTFAFPLCARMKKDTPKEIKLDIS